MYANENASKWALTLSPFFCQWRMENLTKIIKNDNDEIEVRRRKGLYRSKVAL